VPDVSKLRVLDCVACATLQHPNKLDDKAVCAANLGHIGYGKYRLLLPGPVYKIFAATFLKFDEQVFDFAADAVKEVTGIRNITGDDDIISDEMRLLANNDEGEEEFAEVSKAAPPVDAQTVTITLAMSQARRWRRWRKFDATRYGTVHRYRHGIFPLTQLILQNRRLSLRLQRLPTRTSGSRLFKRRLARLTTQAPGPWFHTSLV
jgi:hypothetical protein